MEKPVQLFNVVAIAVALAMDAFAVAIATGVCLKEVNHRQVFRLSWHFGLFQALMPIIGWSAGAVVHTYMAAFGHWIAFGLLSLIGINMIREAFKPEDCDIVPGPHPGVALGDAFRGHQHRCPGRRLQRFHAECLYLAAGL